MIKIKYIKILILLLTILSITFPAIAQSNNVKAPNPIKTRLLIDEKVLAHKYAILSNAEVKDSDLELLARNNGDLETIVLVCVKDINFKTFSCNKDSVFVTSEKSKVVKLSNSSDNILVTTILDDEIIVVPENIILNYKTNELFYKYLLTYEAEFEHYVNNADDETTVLIQPLINIFLVTSALGIFILFAFLLPKFNTKTSLKETFDTFKKSVSGLEILTINYYILAMGLAVTIFGLALVSLSDLHKIDTLYISTWIQDRLHGNAQLDSTLVIMAILMYLTLAVSITANIIINTKRYAKNISKDLKIFSSKLRLDVVIPLILISQSLATLFSSKSNFSVISTINLLLLTILTIYRTKNIPKFNKFSPKWKILILMLSTLYITFIFLSFYDIVGSNASKETYLIETNAESFLTPGTFDANSHKGTQYLTSNEPIFVKDILVYHPDYYNIKYSRIKDTQLEDGAYIVETSEERLINTIVESRDLETLFKKEPSAYFVTEKYVPSNSMEISIKCSVDINPTIVDLSIFGERSSQKDSIFFFPGCYRENLTFQAVNPLQDVFIEKNIYKIENIPSDQINSVVLENTPVTYLKLDKIHNRLAYSYISLGSNLESNGILAVGTDEGSYLEKRFMQLVNNSNTKDGFNLTLVLSYFKKSGFFDKDEKIKIDSLNDDVYIEILNGTLD